MNRFFLLPKYDGLEDAITELRKAYKMNHVASPLLMMSEQDGKIMVETPDHLSSIVLSAVLLAKGISFAIEPDEKEASNWLCRVD